MNDAEILSMEPFSEERIVEIERRVVTAITPQVTTGRGARSRPGSDT